MHLGLESREELDLVGVDCLLDFAFHAQERGLNVSEVLVDEGTCLHRLVVFCQL